MEFNVDAIKQELQILFLWGDFIKCASIYDLLIWYQMLEIIRSRQHSNMQLDGSIVLSYTNVLQICNNYFYIHPHDFGDYRPSSILHTKISDVIREIRSNPAYEPINRASFTPINGELNTTIRLFETDIILNANISPYDNIVNMRNALFNVVFH